jgi:hypothetical protein
MPVSCLRDRIKNKGAPPPAPPENPKHKEKPQGKPKGKPQKPKKKYDPKFGLPDKSHIEADYDASNQRWEVVLTVGDQQFKAVESELQFGFKRVGQAWRKAQPKKVPQEAAPVETATVSETA